MSFKAIVRQTTFIQLRSLSWTPILDMASRMDTKKTCVKGDWTMCSKYDNDVKFNSQHNCGDYMTN